MDAEAKKLANEIETAISNHMSNPEGYAAQTADLIESQAQRIAELEAEADLSEKTRDRMATLLTGVANALRGEPPELTSWSWHDLPERATAAIQAIAVMEGAARDSARMVAELEAKTIWFVGVNPINPTGGAIPPMVPESWRFGFKSDGQNQGCAMRFGFFDDGPFVAWDAVKEQVAFAERAKSDAGRFHTEEEGDAYTHGFFEGEQYEKNRVAELEAAAVNPWRSMDSAPKDGTIVILLCDGDMPTACLCLGYQWMYADELLSNAAPEGPQQIKAWMPIPEFKEPSNG